MSTPDRRAMLERGHPMLSIRGQCRLLGIARSGVYRPAPGHKIFPYLLRDLVIDRPNQVWAADITVHPDRSRLPLPGRDHRLGEPGGAGLAAVEHDGRRVLRRRAGRGAGALRQARNLRHRPGQPVHRRRLHRPAGRRRHPDLEGRPRPPARSGVFIERLWRSLKYEDISLEGYADGREARAGIASWIGFYNGRRPHPAPGGRTRWPYGARTSAARWPATRWT